MDLEFWVADDGIVRHLPGDSASVQPMKTMAIRISISSVSAAGATDVAATDVCHEL